MQLSEMGRLYDILARHVPEDYLDTPAMTVVRLMVISLNELAPEHYVEALCLMHKAEPDILVNSITPEESLEWFLQGLLETNFFSFYELVKSI
jgi:hypothetical protein